MNKEDTGKIIAVMMATYPNYEPREMKGTIDIWQEMLSDYSYLDVSTALKAYIATDKSGFAPSIGQIIDKIHTIRSPDVLSDAEAWSLVWEAIQNSGYDSEAEFEKLPTIVKKAVGSADVLKSWGTDEFFSYERTRTNFLFSYKKESNRLEKMEKLPSDVKKLIGSVKIGIEEK